MPTYKVDRKRITLGKKKQPFLYEDNGDRLEELFHPETGAYIRTRLTGNSTFGQFVNKLAKNGIPQVQLEGLLELSSPHMSRLKKYGLRDGDVVAALSILLEEASIIMDIPRELRGYHSVYSPQKEEQWRQYCRAELWRILEISQKA